ncbi:MAG: glycosyltransferase [Mesorhizobium sp.]|nr:glycosyltransferase [Mesorhizobium sp. M4A.F.Ca.ET.029.04.2.1]RWD08032.1 MAG: glycosyltransferase [Mesorhizobium sp.]TIW31992.1 MAG: WecB/TagA/CpsF family glycosyltransferase [Mesorhizobium sp.]
MENPKRDFEGSGRPSNADGAAAARQESAPLPEKLSAFPTVLIGGLPITVIDRREAAHLMIAAARGHLPGCRPYYFTSANGDVIAQTRANAETAGLFREADQIFADGQPLVFASRLLCGVHLPERVATTDLFHDVAKLAEREGTTFYLLGSTEAENRNAVAGMKARYPGLRIVGNSHGYLAGETLERKLDEINALAPDILWLGLGVPREQIFVRDFASRLSNVGVIKTSGGLFDHLAGKVPRAPLWVQKAGFEWLWRVLMEPRRLFWRYFTTSPQAIYAILRYSK